MEISVHSKPNSYVGLLGVDQSVLLLKKGNDIEQSTVFEELAKYNEVSKYNYEWYRGYDYSTWRDFSDSDTVLITNAKQEFRKFDVSFQVQVFNFMMLPSQDANTFQSIIRKDSTMVTLCLQ